MARHKFRKKTVITSRDIHVAHVLNADTNHLNQTISKSIDCSCASYYLRDCGDSLSGSEMYRRNERWIVGTKHARYGGVLMRPVLNKFIKSNNRLRTLLLFLFTDFSLFSWVKILKGGRYVVIHGFQLQLSTIIIMRLMGKYVSYINWAGPPRIGTIKGRLDVFGMGMLTKIYVLMYPEICYFTKYVDKEKVKLLPYPIHDKSNEQYVKLYGITPPAKILLLGNSTCVMNRYGEVLAKIDPGSWDKIICMLNYGRADAQVDVDFFVAKYKEKFGEAFLPWRAKVSLDEYRRLIISAPFYICPSYTQSGLALIRESVLQGKTIFLRGDNYAWIKGFMGLEVSDIDSLVDYNYKTLAQYAITRQQSCDRVEKARIFWDKYHSVEKWRKTILDDFCR